jgi:predicted peptidase
MKQHAADLNKQIVKPVRLRYLLWLPDRYEAHEGKSWPLILFLHGRGERGADLSLITRYGLPARLAQGFVLPAIVAAPQCSTDSDWTLHDDALLALLDELISGYHVDRSRIYLTGLSMGGREAWRLAATNPSRFAALVPICGRRPDGVRSIEDTRPLCDLPIWVFHGAHDQVVPIAESDGIVAALRSYGANVRYTVYADAGHDSWTQAYAEPDLYTWLLSQQRADGQSDSDVPVSLRLDRS